MALSSYVYVVQNDEGMPYLAFTIKHELVSWLKSLGEDVDLVWGVVRLCDGQDDPAVSMSIAELLGEING